MSPLRVYRVALGMSQRALAVQSGVHRQTIGRLEGGEGLPSRKTALAVSAVLGVDVSELFPANDEERPLAEAASPGAAA